jgi:hypothetical protein
LTGRLELKPKAKSIFTAKTLRRQEKRKKTVPGNFVRSGGFYLSWRLGVFAVKQIFVGGFK